jgi:hypothetical protein
VKTWNVAVPLSGVIYVTVEAENEKDAIEKALQSDDLKLDNVEEWNASRYLVQGNVFYGVLSEANAEEEEG